MTPTGFDAPVTTSGQNTELRNPEQSRAAKSGAARPGTGSHGAAIDRELEGVVEAWPRLPGATRLRILALVESAK